MKQGTIKKLDLTNRQATVEMEDGQEVLLHFDSASNIEISEDETVGLITGELADIGEGYQVELDTHEVAGRHYCRTMVCIS